ncbi:HAD family phosphatase [Weissella diestrammenae]|uniref:HAD family phosphatase n=1 Tax=Weissella diestrammenae TaxID=1162633 RepID=A0A7G9T4K4_9LACO|nr:Cof-type HAD-IIB family hydrolase [Weissella diestrammenae]MCM0582054.1 HAD family phosphatase [Weissella diestrammenae]QNN75029.1 HAD family phosphatase [Weissella diestrammenae]
MTYKMLVSDLDETLLNDDGSINPDNIKTIKQAISQGFKFVPNTGRSFKSVQALLETLGLKDQAQQYVISYNGGAIVENKGNRVIATRAMTFDLAQKIFSAGIKINSAIDVHIYTVDQLFIYNISETDQAYMAERHVPYQLVDTTDLSFLKSEAPIMKVIFEHPDQAVRDVIMTEVSDTVGAENVVATYSSNRYVEFNPKGVDKGSASLQLGELLGIQQSEIMAVGDNANDKSMIDAAGLGVAVQNAIEPIKSVAQLITKKSNNEGAIAEILQQFVLDDHE